MFVSRTWSGSTTKRKAVQDQTQELLASLDASVHICLTPLIFKDWQEDVWEREGENVRAWCSRKGEREVDVLKSHFYFWKSVLCWFVDECIHSWSRDALTSASWWIIDNLQMKYALRNTPSRRKNVRFVPRRGTRFGSGSERLTNAAVSRERRVAVGATAGRFVNRWLIVADEFDFPGAPVSRFLRIAVCQVPEVR